MAEIHGGAVGLTGGAKYAPPKPTGRLTDLSARLEETHKRLRMVASGLEALGERVFGPVPNANPAGSITPIAPGALDQINGNITDIDREISRLSDVADRFSGLA